jgi:hypothetical protein
MVEKEKKTGSTIPLHQWLIVKELGIVYSLYRITRACLEKSKRCSDCIMDRNNKKEPVSPDHSMKNDSYFNYFSAGHCQDQD